MHIFPPFVFLCNILISSGHEPYILLFIFSFLDIIVHPQYACAHTLIVSIWMPFLFLPWKCISPPAGCSRASHVNFVSIWATMLLDFTEVFKQTGQLAQFSPGTTYLLTAVRDQLVVRRCGTFQIARTWDVDTSPSSTNSLVAPNNTRSGTSRVLRSSSTNQNEEATPDGWITHIGWSSDSEYVLACCSKRGVVNVYSMVDPQWNARVEAGAEGLARAEWAPDGRSIICFSEWGLRVTVWSLLDGTATYIQFPKHMDRGYTFRKDGRYFILAERHKSRDTIGVYDARDGYKVTRHFQSPTQSLAAMSLSPNGRHLAVWEGPLEYKLSVLNLAGTVLRTFTPDPDPGLGIRSVAWHPSGAFLAVGGWDDKVHILSSLSWTVVTTFELNSRVPLGVKVWKEPSNWLTKGAEGSFSEYDRGVGITALTITRRDGAKGLPKTGAVQIEWNLTGTMFFVRYESTSTALHIYNFPAPDEPFKPSLKTVLLHATPITRASWNPVRAESLAMSCSRPAVYMWTSNNEWVNDNVGEIEDEGAECIGVPGQEMVIRDVRWAPDGRGILLVDANSYCCAFEVEDDDQGS
ncbi:WD repeat-containing protein WRAP73 OS=Mus musculus GN=Wrap73 PE=2 SV=2 [Rhizoctonia solani AG-1 IB]|uniref:WD repeat-containing protein WRAP73 n=3 Tax=Rhizoctonia solani TaxID=456999 RepID=A0A0B7FNG5_THACB|nr:WD repeat-containing protein WRAP73 OS=Mus musculus GN=Wrap73 PE=2 SV=2 [Rhizoctonia solani AG-1 IB]